MQPSSEGVFMHMNYEFCGDHLWLMRLMPVLFRHGFRTMCSVFELGVFDVRFNCVVKS